MSFISTVLFFAALFSMGYGSYAAYCTWSFLRSKANRAESTEWPPVSIIKPVARLEENYRANFASFCRQDYPRFELIFAFPQGNGPLVSVLEELKKEFPDVDISWIMVHQGIGPNYKVGNLIAGVEKAKYPVLAISDGDMLVGPEYLRETVAGFLQKGTGLVTSLYRNVGIDNLFTALQALTLQTVFIPNVLFSRRVEGLSFAFGATLCTSKEILSSMGGLEMLLNDLADDYQMGNRIRGKGYKIWLSRSLIDHIAQTGCFRDWFLQQLRAEITQKAYRPLGHLGSVITHQASLSVLFLVVERFSRLGWAVFGFSWAARVLTGVLLNRKTIRNLELNLYLWLAPFNDLLNSLIWFTSLFTSKVNWKGRTFRVLKGGKMVEVDGNGSMPPNRI